MTTIMSGKASRLPMQNQNNNNNNIFREDQTDLLNVFQGHHFDLLAGNPPPRNPDFVNRRNPPPLNPDFVAQQQVEQSNLPMTPSELSMLAGSFSASPTVLRRVNHLNPFEEDNNNNNNNTPRSMTSSNPFQARQVSHHYQAVSHDATTSSTSTVFDDHQSLGVPVAFVVAISDDDDEDDEGHDSIPFVSATPIDEREQEFSSGSSFIPGQQQEQDVFSSPAVRGAPAPRPPQSRIRPPPLVFNNNNNSNQDPEWLGRRSNACCSTGPTTRRTTRERQRRKSFLKTTRTTGAAGALQQTTRYSNWSRISVQTHATIREAKRSLKKTIKQQAKKLKQTIGDSVGGKEIQRSIRSDLDRISSSVVAGASRCQHSSCGRRRRR